MKLNVYLWTSLSQILDSIATKELATGEIRKSQGIVKAIRSAIKPDIDAYDEIIKKMNEVKAPFLEKVQPYLGQKNETNIQKIKEIETELSPLIKPLSVELETLQSAQKEKEVEIQLDKNYENWISDTKTFDKFIKPSFKQSEVLQLMDAFGI